jgi:hypothetical protein
VYGCPRFLRVFAVRCAWQREWEKSVATWQGFAALTVDQVLAARCPVAATAAFIDIGPWNRMLPTRRGDATKLRPHPGGEKCVPIGRQRKGLSTLLGPWR